MSNQLTAQEVAVLNISADLWNKICELPEYHSFDNMELQRDIHNIQNRLMARVAVRSNPNMKHKYV